MSDGVVLCPRCGDPIAVADETRLQRGHPELCDACYFETFELIDLPADLSVTYCTQCGAVQHGEEWETVDADDRVDIAVDVVARRLGVHVDADQLRWHVTPKERTSGAVRVAVTVSGVVRETPIEETRVTTVGLSGGTCSRCGRIAGGAYDGVVQIRATDRAPTDAELETAQTVATDLVADRADDGDRDAYITDITPVDGGLDIKVATAGLGRAIAKTVVDRLGGQYTESETLVTEDEEGTKLYRVTFAVRLPPYRVGDVIVPDDDGPVVVTSIHTQLTGRRLTTGAAYEAAASIDARQIGHTEDATETTLVTVEDEHAVQVLDPETYRAETIPRPSYLDTTSDTVPVLKTRRGLYVVPESHV